MADMYTPEEINEIFAAYNDAIDRNIPISKELAQQMKDATLGVKNYTQQLQSSLKQLGTSVKNLGSNLAKGEKGASVYSDTLSSGADALASYSAKFGPAGRALAMATNAITAFGVAALKQSDQLFESFQKVSRAGAVGAGGMTELYDSMKKLGYVPAELERMGQLFAENSKYFALFSSSAIEGGKMFATVADDIQNSPLRAQLFNLGMSVDDINKGIAGYIKQEGSLGKLRSATDRELREGTKAYLREMEILTRLTGQSREEMETQREQALSIDAFYATLKELSPDASKEALNTFNQMSAISKKAAADFATGFSGVITGGTDLLMSTGGASQKYTREFFEKGGKAPEAMQGMADAAQQFVGVTDQIARIGGQFGLTSREITMLTNKGLDPFAEAFAKTTAEVDKAAAGADRTTDAQAKMRDNQIKTGQSMADFVNLGVLPATLAMQGLTKAVEYLTGFLPGGKPSAAQTANAAAQEKAKASGAGFFGRQFAGAKAGIAATFGFGGTTGGGAAEGGGTGITVDDGGVPLLPAGANVFTGESLSGLNDSLVNSLTQAATEYNSITGKTIRVTSGKRSREEQAELYQKYMSGQSKFPAAPPGKSKHELGNSVDISQADADAMAGMGLLAKYGLGRPVAGDPVHIEKISAADGAILSGPRSGYQPNLTMHGTEAVVPLPDGRSIPVTGGANSGEFMTAQLDKLDELISVMKSQLSVSNKLLSYSS
jgi:hypothetical protein